VSVTIHIKGARLIRTVTTEPCWNIEEGRCSSEARCGGCADGFEVDQGWDGGEISRSYTTLAGLFEVLGLRIDPVWGDLPVSALPHLRRALIRALNGGDVSAAIREGSDDPGGPVVVYREGDGAARIGRQYCRTITGSYPAESARRDLGLLLDLVVEAQNRNSGLEWA
jgi:hypothetical protein